jgi:hypothetical protein
VTGWKIENAALERSSERSSRGFGIGQIDDTNNDVTTSGGRTEVVQPLQSYVFGMAIIDQLSQISGAYSRH